MISASDQPPSEESRKFDFVRRNIALIITLLIHALLLLMLLTLTPARRFLPMGSTQLITVTLPSDQPSVTPTKSQTKAKSAAKPKPAAASASSHAPPPPPNPAATQSVPDYPLIKLSHQDMVGLDQTMRTEHAAPSQSAQAGSDSSDTPKAGQGQNGEQLFAAEWYRRPTDTELNYMPRNRLGWGEVACRTAPRFHVEDCYELAESPRGSGLSRGVREAAWQFLVRPPRVGGKLMVGEWVRIRITMTDHKELLDEDGR